MKYKITDKQLDDVIFLYLDNQDFIKSEEYDLKYDFIYFINSESDEDAQIRFDKDYGTCTINPLLVKEISNFFSLSDGHSIDVIVKWVEYTLQMKVSRIFTNTPYRWH